MRKEDATFTLRAPVVHVTEAEVAAPRARVFAALADAAGWRHWFPGVRAAGYTTRPPHGVGTIREADVRGTRWVEEMIAWDEGTRWGWTVTRASVPFATAQVELFELLDGGRGTRIRWTLALEPRLLARLGAPLAARLTRRLFRRAMENLGARLQATPPEGGTMAGTERVLGKVATRLLLENERVRVWELDLAPGARSDPHHHEVDYVLVQIEGDRIAAEPEPDTQGAFRDYIEADVVPGRARFIRRGGIETAVNIGQRRYREILIELK
jgi:beta-alanine degradation protein BauB